MSEWKWFSGAKVWQSAFMLGFGVARDADDGHMCLLIQFGKWLVVIGPHIPTNEAYRND